LSLVIRFGKGAKQGEGNDKCWKNQLEANNAENMEG